MRRSERLAALLADVRERHPATPGGPPRPAPEPPPVLPAVCALRMPSATRLDRCGGAVVDGLCAVHRARLDLIAERAAIVQRRAGRAA